MWKNYLLTTLRSLHRNKTFSLINILGLSLGLTAALFIAIWVEHELSFDRFHSSIDRMHIAMTKWAPGGREAQVFDNTPAPMKAYLEDNIPEVEAATCISTWGGNVLLSVGDHAAFAYGLAVDTSFFQVFSFAVLQGNTKEALAQTHSIILTESLVKKYFPNDNPLGKSIQYGSREELTVGAIVADPPSNSSIQFEYLLSLPYFLQMYNYQPSWDDMSFLTVFVAQEDVRSDVFEAKLKAKSLELDPDGTVSLFSMPFADRRLKSNFTNGVQEGGRIQYVQIFSFAAMLILVIACINFMNLSSVQAGSRAKEVGIRKTAGASRHQLVAQFIGESLFLVAIAVSLALCLIHFLRQPFTELVGEAIYLDLSKPFAWYILGGIWLLTGIGAGIYPALVMSGFKPVAVLKGSAFQQLNIGGLQFRRVLVVMQFVMAIFLIISAIFIYSQLNFIQKKNLGYKKEQVISFQGYDGVIRKKEEFIQTLLDKRIVSHIGLSNQNIMQVENMTLSVDWAGKTENDRVGFRAILIDEGLLQTLSMQILEGRYFSSDFPQNPENTQYVISRLAAQKMGLEDPLGANISLWNMPGTVVGVVEDFHSRSLHEAIDPIIFAYLPRAGNTFYAKIAGNDLAETMAGIEKVYKEFDPKYPFAYVFLDESFEKLYKAEKATSKLSLAFTILAITISCLGIFGLAVFAMEKRKKELGIRKVLGASSAQISWLFSKEFSILTLLSVLFAIPIAWFFIAKWLQNFAYYIQMNVWPFLFGSGIVILLVMLTVLYHALKAANSNPAEVLQSNQ
jgi:putative ABC transport system permease protein